MHPGAMVGGDAHCRGLQMHRPGAARLLVEYADGTVQGFHKVLHHLCVNKAAPCTGTLHGWSVPGTALVLDKPCNTDMLLLAHKGCPGRPRGTFAMGCSSALMALFEQGKLSLSAGQTISQCRGNYHSVQDKLSLSAGQTISQCRGNYHSVQGKLSLSAGDTITQCRGNYHSVQGKLSLSAGETITQCRANYHSVQGKLSLSAGQTRTVCFAAHMNLNRKPRSTPATLPQPVHSHQFSPCTQGPKHKGENQCF